MLDPPPPLPPHICPLTWANQLDLGGERGSGVARSAIDSQQSHNWPVKRKGFVGGEGEFRCCARLPVQPPHPLPYSHIPPTHTEVDIVISIFIVPQLPISHPCDQQQLHMDHICRTGGDVKEGRGDWRVQKWDWTYLKCSITSLARRPMH